MTEHIITRLADGRWQVYRSADGRPPYEPAGRIWPEGWQARYEYDRLVQPFDGAPEAVSGTVAPAHHRVAHPAPPEVGAPLPASGVSR